MPNAAAFMANQPENDPVAWIQITYIESVEDVVALARNVKALPHKARPPTVQLFTSLPFHALPLLGALLSPHVMNHVTFMEFDSTVEGGSYRPLELPVP